MSLGPLGLLTWGMRVPFKVCIQQFQCLRCEWRPAFPLLGWLNTNEFSEMILSTLISETQPACNFIRCTKTRLSVDPVTLRSVGTNREPTRKGGLAQIFWISICGSIGDKFLGDRKYWNTLSPGDINIEGGYLSPWRGSPSTSVPSINTGNLAWETHVWSSCKYQF